MRYGRIREDDSGHYYVIPLELVSNFDILSIKLDETYANYLHKVGGHEEGYYDLLERFEKEFGRYRTDDIESLTVVMETG